jgi:type VI protein secretion system component VasA
MYTGASAIILASVLRHFLALHTSINSFVQLSARRVGDEKTQIWKRWSPLSGEQPVR